MKKLILATATIAIGSFAQVGLAATATDNDMDITVAVIASCTISVTDMQFGAISTRDTGANETQTSTVTVTCTADADYDVGFDFGTNEALDGTAPARLKHTDAAASEPYGVENPFLNYGLYRDSGHSNLWGNTVGTNTVSGTGNGDDQTITVYGKIEADQEVSLGSYADTVTATVWYADPS